MRKNYLIAWPALIVLVAITAVIVILPAWLIQPFGAQTSRGIEVSFLLRRWSPIVTVVLALLAIAMAVYVWLKSRKLYGKLSLLIPVSLVLVFTWFARQNHFEWMFNPLKHSDYVAASKADFVED